MAATDERARVLVVEDDEVSRRSAVTLLEAAGYDCLEAADAKTGLALAFTRMPDCVLLDGQLPDLDGMDVLARLRGHIFTSRLPVIFVTARAGMDDRVDALEAGADDYVVKPFDGRELSARVESVLRRTQAHLAADPLTKLPGNVAVREQLEKRLQTPDEFALAYVDLDNFKAYVDRYGFERAAHVIQKAGQLLYNAVIDRGEPDDFVGHIGGDDFILGGSTPSVERICEALVTGFGVQAPTFYDAADRERGYLEGPDRYGVERRFPLVALSVAAVVLSAGEARPSLSDLAGYAARCKNHVKEMGGGRWARYVYPQAIPLAV